jgi:hypothetical protein
LRDILTNTHGLKLAGLRQNRAAQVVLLSFAQAGGLTSVLFIDVKKASMPIACYVGSFRSMG